METIQNLRPIRNYLMTLGLPQEQVMSANETRLNELMPRAARLERARTDQRGRVNRVVTSARLWISRTLRKGVAR